MGTSFKLEGAKQRFKESGQERMSFWEKNYKTIKICVCQNPEERMAREATASPWRTDMTGQASGQIHPTVGRVPFGAWAESSEEEAGSGKRSVSPENRCKTLTNRRIPLGLTETQTSDGRQTKRNRDHGSHPKKPKHSKLVTVDQAIARQAQGLRTVISGGAAMPQHIGLCTGRKERDSPSKTTEGQRIAKWQSEGIRLPNNSESTRDWQDPPAAHSVYVINLEVFPLSVAWLKDSDKVVGVRGCNLGGNVVLDVQLEAKTTFAQLAEIIQDAADCPLNGTSDVSYIQGLREALADLNQTNTLLWTLQKQCRKNAMAVWCQQACHAQQMSHGREASQEGNENGSPWT